MNETNYRALVDKDWTLFLDRDGVINSEIVGSYVTGWEEFQYLDGSQEAIKQLGDIFGRIVVVSNQRGVGRGIMTLDSLKEIHGNMQRTIEESGGRLDKVYACTAIEDTDHNRKPNTGMATQAKEDFPEIDFRKSIMVGNNMSDMEFGKRMNMLTVFLTTTNSPVELPNDLVDEQYPSLLDWANSIMAEIVS